MLSRRLRDRQSEWSRNRTSDLKIGKNVKISEFDHIGACLCGREVSVPLFYHSAILKAVICGQILPFSIQHKKCHFISHLVCLLFSVLCHCLEKLVRPTPANVSFDSNKSNESQTASNGDRFFRRSTFFGDRLFWQSTFSAIDFFRRSTFSAINFFGDRLFSSPSSSRPPS